MAAASFIEQYKQTTDLHLNRSVRSLFSNERYQMCHEYRV